MSRPVIIMVAPNGARKTREDHAAIPETIAETVAEAGACHDNGATIIHAHVRDNQKAHTLDPVLYRELIIQMTQQVPGMLVQITTEAVGRYAPGDQADCVRDVCPQMATMALRELIRSEEDIEPAREFLYWCRDTGIHIQHVLFSSEELDRFNELQQQGVIPPGRSCAIFVLGRYTSNQESSPEDLEPFLSRHIPDAMDWFICAFGKSEQACLMAAAHAGGHVRVGFENNIYLPGGEPARSTAGQVADLVESLESRGFVVASPEQSREILLGG